MICGLDFHPGNCHESQSFAHLIAQVPKSIELSVQLFSNPNEKNDKLKEQLGYKQIAALFSAVSPQERVALMSEIVKDSKIAIDNLHNVKGHLSKIVELERDQPSFDDGLFITNLHKQIGRLSTAEMNGESFRICAILFREIIEPSVAVERREACVSLLDNWLEIQFFMYEMGELETEDPTIMAGIKTRVHGCCFVHLQQVC